MLGDVAVMVHPEDERYQRFIGKAVTLPLVGRAIPVIADDYVDKDFGTGVVKVTPAHDANDYAVGQRHGLPMIGVLTLDAHINDQAPARYQGMERFAARKAIVADLQAQGLLIETRKHKLMVPRCARTGQIIEPMLTDQWFVAMNKAPTLPASHGSLPPEGAAPGLGRPGAERSQPCSVTTVSSWVWMSRHSRRRRMLMKLLRSSDSYWRLLSLWVGWAAVAVSAGALAVVRRCATGRLAWARVPCLAALMAASFCARADGRLGAPPRASLIHFHSFR